MKLVNVGKLCPKMINIGEKVANQVKITGKKYLLESLPAKINLNGVTLKPLEKDALTLANQPKKYSSQAEKLKAFYESKGVRYLLPSEEWSNKKILDTIDLLGKDIDKLIKSKTLNKQTLQEAIDKLAPEAKGKIIIKDFVDLEKSLRAEGKSENYIKNYLENCGARTSIDIHDTKVYLNFEELKGDNFDQTIFKTEIKHEMKHAISSRFQNTNATDTYKNNEYKGHNQNDVFGKIFNQFEQNYFLEPNWAETKINQQSLLKWLGFNSEKDLYNDFEKTLNKVINRTKSTEGFKIEPAKKSRKQFFNFLKNMAIDEKEAYQSNKIFREYYGNPNTPTGGELEPLKYDMMEKFFEQKRIQANKQTNNLLTPNSGKKPREHKPSNIINSFQDLADRLKDKA